MINTEIYCDVSSMLILSLKKGKRKVQGVKMSLCACVTQIRVRDASLCRMVSTQLAD